MPYTRRLLDRELVAVFRVRRGTLGEEERELFGLSRRCTVMESVLSDARILGDSVSDPAIFSSLYERHLGAVARYVARRTGPELSEDLTAEVFVRAFRKRAVFRDDHVSALPWLLGDR
jgi:Sigma-70 region 2